MGGRTGAERCPPPTPALPLKGGGRQTLSVTEIASGSLTPGRRGFSRVAASVAARAGSRAQSVTRFPARAAWIASAVPQAPAPITATLLIDQSDHLGSLARLARAQPIEQGGEDRRRLRLEADRAG